jgi:Tfp pilus assembly protein PilF
LSYLGVIRLYDSDWLQAKRFFNEALARDSKNSTAMWGIAGLYKKFGYKSKFEAAAKKAKSAGKPRGALHPLMSI